MKKFKKYIKEDATSTMSNTGGMGPVISAQPSTTPGSVNASDSTPGSGDIGTTLGTYAKPMLNLKKRKDKKKKNIQSFQNFSPIN